MTSISSFSNSVPDMLSLMRPAMTGITSATQSPATTGVDTDALGSSYLQGASQTVTKLEENISRRTRALEWLDKADPAGAKQEREQLDLLERLRTRIQESITRVGDIMSGQDPQAVAEKERTRQQLDELDQLEARRTQLAQQLNFEAPIGIAPAAAQVADAYASSRAS